MKGTGACEMVLESKILFAVTAFIRGFLGGSSGLSLAPPSGGGRVVGDVRKSFRSELWMSSDWSTSRQANGIDAIKIST